MIQLPHLPKKELLEYLVKNKAAIMAQKSASIKYADAVSSVAFYSGLSKADSAVKAEEIMTEATKLVVKAVINTTKLFDSHGDVHIDGLWNKSLKESKAKFLVKEHKFSFDGIISDQVKASVETMSWKDLGFNYKGDTQALLYESTIVKEESPDMFKRYATGKVNQHSVGMRYIKYALAIGDPRYKEEYKVWEKYYEDVANKDDIEEYGYFYAVTEAKDIEGSAVVKGSNFATPTISVEAKTAAGTATAENEPTEPKLFTPEMVKNFYNPIKHV